MSAIHLCRGDGLKPQEERTEDGASLQTLQTSAIDIGKLVSVLQIQRSVSNECSLILQNYTAHKGGCRLYLVESRKFNRRGINRLKH